MKYEMVKELDEEGFRRLTGIKRATFNKMVEILRAANKEKKAKGGRAERREYAAYGVARIPDIFSQSYGVSESTAYKTVKWVSNTTFCVARAKRTLKKQ